VPLIFAMFIASLFIPSLRKMKKSGIPKVISVSISILAIAVGGFVLYHLLRLSSQEILATKEDFSARLQMRLTEFDQFSIQHLGFSLLEGLLNQSEVQKEWILKNLKSVWLFLVGAIPQILTTLFFVVLLLFESFDFERFLNKTILKQRYSSIKTFKRIEKEVITFLQVKFFVSLATGLGTGLACYAFDISFPIFWGLFAFLINFIQMVGSIITIVACSIFAFVELELSSTLLYFILSITGVQVLFGSILEPIFMGKSFSINIVVVLIMLMFWGYVWGIPGMILSIPLTVFIKIILEQFDKTRPLAKLMQ
jgi:predicted PurR-regulated permease PerM